MNDVVWKSDRVLLGDLVFRIEESNDDGWDLGDECFRLRKPKRMIDQYEAFWARRPEFRQRHVLELGIFDGGSIAF